MIVVIGFVCVCVCVCVCIRRYSKCPICLTVTESARASAHMKRQHSLNEEEREFYLAQMLEERDSAKDKSQGRKREGFTRGMSLFERREETRKDLIV